MTYVEFFDKTALENISSCLTNVPDRVIFIGDNNKLMNKHIEIYRQLLLNRGHDVEFFTMNVPKRNITEAVDALQEVVDTFDDCVFDITGGDALLILALGIIYQRNPDKNIQIHRFNLRTNTAYDCDGDGQTVYRDPPALTVDENLRLYGGAVSYGGVDEEKTYLWNLTTDFLRDAAVIWAICSRDIRAWNVELGVLDAMNQVGMKSEDGLSVTATMGGINWHLGKYGAAYSVNSEILWDLRRCGLIMVYEENGSEVTVSFKNPQIKRCLTKAGTALELQVYLAALRLTDGDGKPLYNDALNGVLIDWDGEFHDEESAGVYDTENEIDVLLMHGSTPVFISCKNGVVTSAELYKLNTVAERFGSRYSKKVLVATSIPDDTDAGNYLRQRAADMNIRLIENIQHLSDAELEKKLKGLWGY